MSRRRIGASPEGAYAVESSEAWPVAPQCRQAGRLARRCRRGSRCGGRVRGSGRAGGPGILRDWNSSSRVGQPPLPSRIGAGPRCFCVRDFRKTYMPDLRSMRLARVGPCARRGRSRSSGSRLAWLAICAPSTTCEYAVVRRRGSWRVWRSGFRCASRCTPGEHVTGTLALVAVDGGAEPGDHGVAGDPPRRLGGRPLGALGGGEFGGLGLVVPPARGLVNRYTAPGEPRYRPGTPATTVLPGMPAALLPSNPARSTVARCLGPWRRLRLWSRYGLHWRGVDRHRWSADPVVEAA
jgi:hypothetical protein